MLQDRGRQKDVVRVLDFGIAKLRDDNRVNNAMTQAGDMLGTPQYMAPEQIRAEPIDGRTDVYALGCMLYEMLTGRLPFEAPTVMALLSKHLMETPPPPSQRRPDLALPPAIDDLVMCAMAKHPAQRPPTMEQLGEHIAAMLATLPPDAAGPSAAVGVPYVPTPPAYSAFAPHTPPPPHTPTPHTPTPHTAPPQPSHFAPPGAPPVAAYNPYQTNTPTPPATPATSAGSNKTMMFVIIGALVLGGAGAGVYFMTRDGDKPPPSDPDSPEKPDDDPPDPPDDDPPANKGTGADPWGGRPGGTTIDLTASLPGETIDVGQGARFIMPPGFTEQKAPDGVMAVDVSRGILFGFAAVDSDTDDANTLARRYASQTGMKLTSVSQEFIQGATRKFAVFEGNMGNVPVRHVVIAFLSPSYRIGMIIHVPQSIGNDPAVQQLAMEAASRRLLLPGS